MPYKVSRRKTFGDRMVSEAAMAAIVVILLFTNSPMNLRLLV